MAAGSLLVGIQCHLGERPGVVVYTATDQRIKQ